MCTRGWLHGLCDMTPVCLDLGAPCICLYTSVRVKCPHYQGVVMPAQLALPSVVCNYLCDMQASLEHSKWLPA